MRTATERDTDERLAVLAVAHGWSYERSRHQFGVEYYRLRRLCAEAGVESTCHRWGARHAPNPRKQEGIERVQSGEPPAVVAQDLGVSLTCLYRWCAKAGVMSPLAHRGRAHPQDLKERAVSLYDVGYGPSQIENLTGVPRETVRWWVRDELSLGACTPSP